mgnify:FL=1
MTTILCLTYIDPLTIEPLLASRLIPLDKGGGAVRPIGTGEVMRRIIDKYVMNVVKTDLIWPEVGKRGFTPCYEHYL